MQDTTLLDRSKPITMDGLRAFFREHDFSAQTSGYKFERASSEKNQIYIKTKGLFRKAWNQQMKSLTGKGSLINFSSDAPVRCLEESEEKLVAGTVMEILGNEPYAEKLIDQVLTSMRKPMNTEIEKFAQARGKTTADLTEEEFRQAVDAFADEFLARMMKLLLQVQNVPELMDFMSQDAAHEDFDEDVYRNYDKITFERKWDHLRTRIGQPIPFDQELQETISSDTDGIPREAIDLGMVLVDSSEELYHQILDAFINSLDDETDRQIMRMRADGKTQTQIAESFGFANHSVITKRLRKLKKKYKAFMRQYK